MYHQCHRTAAVDFNVWTAVKGSWVCDGQSRIAFRYGLLPRKAVLIRLAVEGNRKTADLVQLLLNVQIAGDDAVGKTTDINTVTQSVRIV